MNRIDRLISEDKTSREGLTFPVTSLLEKSSILYTRLLKQA